MKEYLVQWRNLETNEVTNLIKTWSAVQAILKDMTRIGGQIHIYRLDKRRPEEVFPGYVNGAYWLEDAYGNAVEG